MKGQITESINGQSGESHSRDNITRRNFEVQRTGISKATKQLEAYQHQRLDFRSSGKKLTRLEMMAR